MNRIYLSPDTAMKNLAKTLFGYNGKKYKIVLSESCYVDSNWSGGSHTDTRVVSREQMKVASVETHWMDPHQLLTIPKGYFVVQHSYFCGKDMGITFIVRPDEADTGLIPEKTDLTAPERTVLTVHASLKSFARKEQIERYGLADRYEDLKVSLIKKGMLMKNGAVTPEGRNNRYNNLPYSLRFDGDNPVWDHNGTPMELS